MNHDDLGVPRTVHPIDNDRRRERAPLARRGHFVVAINRCTDEGAKSSIDWWSNHRRVSQQPRELADTGRATRRISSSRNPTMPPTRPSRLAWRPSSSPPRDRVTTRPTPSRREPQGCPSRASRAQRGSDEEWNSSGRVVHSVGTISTMRTKTGEVHDHCQSQYLTAVTAMCSDRRTRQTAGRLRCKRPSDARCSRGLPARRASYAEIHANRSVRCTACDAVPPDAQDDNRAKMRWRDSSGFATSSYRNGPKRGGALYGNVEAAYSRNGSTRVDASRCSAAR